MSRGWIEPIRVAGLAVALSVSSWSPSRWQEQQGTCGGAGETVAIYDCQTGLVLWSREQPEQIPPMMGRIESFAD